MRGQTLAVITIKLEASSETVNKFREIERVGKR